MLQALSEKHNSFLRPLKKKGFKEERVTKIGLYDIGKSRDPGIQQEPQVNALGPGSIHTQMWEELRNGAQRIGDAALYALGQRVTSGGGASIAQAAALAVWLGSEASGPLSGRLISAVTDDVPLLPAQIERIMASDALTLRRVELR